MSGIAGIINFHGAPAEPGLLGKMTAAINHRGPDGIHHWVRGPVALGQCMLRSTQESLEETQPLTNDDETLVLVMDGWLSNWEELRAELVAKGSKLRTRADAELVLRAYESWGKGCLAHIDGDFAFVIWDEGRCEAFCARDRVGNRPLNYYFSGKTLVFASELHPILALPWVPETPNEGMIAEIVSNQWLSKEETIWTGVNRVPPSNWMTVTASGVQRACYWRPDVKKRLAYKRDEEYFEHYRVLLFDIVRRYARSHEPIACEVSGGLDSSAVFSVAEHLRRESKLPAPGLKGYTLAFHGDERADEVSYARAVGAYLGLAVSEISPALPPLEWYAENARRIRNIPGYPNCESHSSMYGIAFQSGQRAILTGVGGDQFLVGSPRYYSEELMEGNLSTFVRCFDADVRAMGTIRALRRLTRYGLVPLAPTWFKLLLRQVLKRVTEQSGQDARWLSPHLRELLRAREQRAKDQPMLATERPTQLRLLQMLDRAFDLAGREIMETIGSRHGLELRRPFYDRAYVEFAFAMPERLRSIGGRSKFIHCESLKGFLPEDIRLRKTKADFTGPLEAPLNPLRAYFTNQLPRECPEWFDERGFDILWKRYREAQPYSALQSLSLWGSLGVGLAMGHRPK
jgi:asparagine synthase (glutamine-hydrolysing)